MRAVVLAACLFPCLALANPVSVNVAPTNASHLHFNADAGLTKSGLPTVRAEMVVAKSGVELKVAPLKTNRLGSLLDNGAAAHGWHSAWRSEDMLKGWRAGQHNLAFLAPMNLRFGQGCVLVDGACPRLDLRLALPAGAFRLEDRVQQGPAQLLVPRAGQVHVVAPR